MRLQKQLTPYDLASLVGSVEDQNKQWLYQSRDGSVLFDLMGDPLLRSTDPEASALDKG